MDTEYLREFAVICKSKSLNEAAAKLHASPSSLSRHLSLLEQELRANLITRDTTSFELTPCGDYVLEKSLQIIKLLDDLQENTESLGKTSFSTVVIGGFLRSYGLSHLVNNAISVLHKRNANVIPKMYEPHCSASADTMSCSDSLESLESGTVDIIVALTSEDGMQGRFCHQELPPDPLAVFLPEDSNLLNRDNPLLALTDLKDETLVVPTAHSSMINEYIKMCRKTGFEPKVHSRVSHTWGTMYVRKDRSEYFVLPQSDAFRVANPDISGLVQIDINDKGVGFERSAIWKKDNPNEGIPLFVDALVEACRSQL